MATNEWDDVNRPLPGPLPKPTIDDMKYELMRLQRTHPAPPRVAPISALQGRAQEATGAATDVARTLLGGPVAYFGSPWMTGLQALNAGPGYMYRKYAEGDQQAADKFLEQRVKTPEQNQYDLYKLLVEPTTASGRTFQDTLAGNEFIQKLPPIFPGLTSGIPVRRITPTDVRVMGANAKRVGTQVLDIPTDFKNAQSGLRKIDPVTGEDTLGAKLQGTAESVGGTLERQAAARTARTDTAGMSPLSAAASALMPDTSMNVMRPVDSRILRANPPKGAAPLAIPASATGSRGDIGRLDPLSTELNKHTLTYDEMMKPHPLLNTYMAQYARDNNAVHDVGIDTALAQRALEKFPDAPNPSEAILALEAFHGGSNSEGMAKEHMAAADAYAKSPLAAAVATQPGVTPIPTSDEFLRRYEASEKWRTNNFPAFVTKYLGTEADPALSLASQGLTFQDPEHVILAGENSVRTAAKNRVAAGMPEKTALQTALEAKENELAQKDTQWRAIEDTREARTFSKNNIEPLQKEIENLKLGAAYENMADAAVIPTKVQDMLGVMDYSATQFFPSLTGEKNPEAIAYKLEKAAIARLGFDDIVDQMHKDILDGKYDPDKVKNISVDRYIRENAVARQKADAAAQALRQAYIDAVTQRFTGMAQNVPADALKYENAFVLESTKDTPANEVTQRASDDSGVLDNCIGKGSDASQSGKQPKHPFTGLAGTLYEPVFLLDQPGVRNPRAAQDTSTFIKRVYSGENILGHVRDETTGFPVANIELKVHRRRDGTQGYTLGYVSGPTTDNGTNGPIDQKYHNAIRDYLNRYADKIGSVDTPLINNTSIRDTMSGEYDSIGVEAGYRDNRDLRAAYPDLPRFITLDDARSIRNQTYKMPEPAASAVPAPLEIKPYKHTDFVDDLGLTLEQDLEARRIIDAIHIQADADAGTHNVLHEYNREVVHDHIVNTPQLRALLSNSPQDVQRAIFTYFDNLPDSQDAPMPRRVANASTENLRSQITPNDEAALTGAEAHIRGELVSNNFEPNEYFTLLRDAPLSYFGTDVEPGVVELAIRNVADELQVIRQREIAQAQTPAAPAPALPAPANFRTGAYDFVNEALEGLRRDRLYTRPIIERAETVVHRVLENFDFTNAPAELPALIRDAAVQEGGPTAQVITHIAQMLNSSPIVRSTQVATLGDWEPEAPHPAGPGGVQDVAHHLLEIERRPDGTLSTEGLASTAYALLHGQLDYPGFTHIPAGPERAQAMQSLILAFSAVVEDALGFPITNLEVAPAPEPPALLQGRATNLVEAYLQNLQGQFGDTFAELVRNTVVPIVQNMNGIGNAEDLAHRIEFAGAGHNSRAVETATNEIAERLRNNEHVPPPPAPEPAPAQVAQFSPVPRHIQNETTDVLLRALDNPAAVNNVIDIATRYIQGNTPEDLAVLPQLIRTTNVGLHQTMGMVSRELLARQIEDHHPQQAREQNLLRTPYNELQQVITPIERTLVTSMQTRIARSAGDYGVSGAEVADMIRNRAQTYGDFNTDLSMLSSQALEVLARDTSDSIEAQNRARDRRGPFQHGGSMAVRGLPLGNLNIRPSITADALRGPDTQPISNFIQQVKGMPGVTKEGTKTGLMAFEDMDPNTRMTKAAFVRELLPSSYEIVDLKGAAQEDMHIAREMIDDDIDVAHVVELFVATYDIPDEYIAEFADGSWDDLSAGAKKFLAKKKIRNEEQFDNAMTGFREEIIDQEIEDQYGDEPEAREFMYATTQRLVHEGRTDQYGEYGVTHPDQQGPYMHYDSAPEGTIGHFRGTYNATEPMRLAYTGHARDAFETLPNSYAIEEIQSDVQKPMFGQTAPTQVRHLHQVHGLLFKAAIQKALELGADNVYLPTAKTIAARRHAETRKFAPIYDQAIVKEGLKPLLKIPGVTSNVVNGYHEIRFSPEAKEHILNGPGQTIPGYAKGGIVH